MRTNLYEDISTNTLMTFDEVRNEYMESINATLPISDDEMQLIIFENLFQNGGNIKLINESSDAVLKWSNKYAEHNEVDRHYDRAGRDQNVKDIYEMVSCGDVETIIDTFYDVKDIKLMEQLETLLQKDNKYINVLVEKRELFQKEQAALELIDKALEYGILRSGPDENGIIVVKEYQGEEFYAVVSKIDAAKDLVQQNQSYLIEEAIREIEAGTHEPINEAGLEKMCESLKNRDTEIKKECKMDRI